MHILSGVNMQEISWWSCEEAKGYILCQRWQTDWMSRLFLDLCISKNWITVTLLLILSIVFTLATKKDDYTCAFIHA